MEIWQAIVLGAVQGLAEFLPISSSGHLILVQHWMGITENAFFYSVMLHIGTLIPVFVILWRQIIGLFRSPFSKLGCLILATIPAGAIGIILSATIDFDTIFAENVWLLTITFMLTAIELFVAERLSKKKELLQPINSKTASIMGFGQALAVFPGLSRSGTTIVFGTLAGTKKEENANFTFLMSIPIILAAALLEGYDCIKNPATMQSINWIALLVGVVTAMVMGYIAIKFMLKIIKKANYTWFSVYLVGVSVLSLLMNFGIV